MGKHVSVLTLKAFSSQGQNYRAGVILSLPVIEGLVLARERKVTLSAREIRKAQQSAVVTHPVPIPEPEPQPQLEQAEPISEEIASDLETPKPKRRYKRRDIEAEDSSTLSADSDEDR